MEENNNQSSNELITAFNINNDQIMFEYDVAEFFNVNTETVLQVVKNNPNRFPDDFLYHLTNREYDALCEQFPNSNLKKTTNIPLGFTEPGMAMLSAYLNTNQAVDYSVSVIRIYNELNRESNRTSLLEQRVNNMEQQIIQQFDNINHTLDGLCSINNISRTPIGFKLKK